MLDSPSGGCVLIWEACLQLAEQFIEGAVTALPELPVFLDPGGRFAEAHAFDLARAALRVLRRRDEAGVLQHLQVLGDRRLAHGEGFRQFRNRGLSLGEPGKDRTARGVREGGEGGVEALGGRHCSLSITMWL